MSRSKVGPTYKWHKGFLSLCLLKSPASESLRTLLKPACIRPGLRGFHLRSRTWNICPGFFREKKISIAIATSLSTPLSHQSIGVIMALFMQASFFEGSNKNNIYLWRIGSYYWYYWSEKESHLEAVALSLFRVDSKLLAFKRWTCVSRLLTGILCGRVSTPPCVRPLAILLHFAIWSFFNQKWQHCHLPDVCPAYSAKELSVLGWSIEIEQLIFKSIKNWISI